MSAVSGTQEIYELARQLREQLRALHQALIHERDRPIWIGGRAYCDDFAKEYFYPSGSLLEPDARAITSALYSRLEFLDGQEPQETLTLPGIVGASSETIALVQKINHLKGELIKATSGLRRRYTSAGRDGGCADKHIRSALQQAGLPRPALKQCYRKIPLLCEPPSYVGWTWAQVRAIKTYTAGELLASISGDGTEAWLLSKLAALDPKERLAQVQPLPPVLKANVCFESGTNTETLRRLVPAPLPLIYPCAAGSALPRTRPPALAAPRKRRERVADQKLESTPYIPALRIYRYKTREAGL
ncbi:hypothetical protein [Thioalkalivibrio thiocyanodenitrificans]|uniref:hypothetical protein n=1 Tax=Thioalkalivibrio thiocyanodenitrificans TaxID=243063 RepID=UPI00036BC2EF|nr:hypothetical protein [Thioalkalivibrio thiocyanodenitrificans]